LLKKQIISNKDSATTQVYNNEWSLTDCCRHYYNLCLHSPPTITTLLLSISAEKTKHYCQSLSYSYQSQLRIPCYNHSQRVYYQNYQSSLSQQQHFSLHQNPFSSLSQVYGLLSCHIYSLLLALSTSFKKKNYEPVSWAIHSMYLIFFYYFDLQHF